jgi:hypothetical protein
LSSPSSLKLFYILHLSKPAANRLVYREIRRLQPRKILELGVGTAQRAELMIQLAGEFHAPAELLYTGVDPFEDRSEQDGPGISLREAHRLLKATGAKVQLVPGTPADGLSRVANMLGKVDFILFSAPADAEQASRTWFYVPRLLHEQTQVFLETRGDRDETVIRPVSVSEIRNLATVTRRRAA